MRTLRKIIGVIFYLIAAVALILAFFCLVEGFKSSNWFGGIAAAVIVIVVALAAFVIGWYIANPGEWGKRPVRHRRKRPTLSPGKRQPHKGMSKRRDFNPLSKNQHHRPKPLPQLMFHWFQSRPNQSLRRMLPRKSRSYPLRGSRSRPTLPHRASRPSTARISERFMYTTPNRHSR